MRVIVTYSISPEAAQSMEDLAVKLGKKKSAIVDELIIKEAKERQAHEPHP